jgi:hypothetical protein
LFDDSPQGKAAQNFYDQEHDKFVGQAWVNRIHTLADDPTYWLRVYGSAGPEDRE